MKYELGNNPLSSPALTKIEDWIFCQTNNCDNEQFPMINKGQHSPSLWIISSFLINPEVIPGRMTMLVTLFLVLINIHNTIQTNSPKVLLLSVAFLDAFYQFYRHFYDEWLVLTPLLFPSGMEISFILNFFTLIASLLRDNFLSSCHLKSI